MMIILWCGSTISMRETDVMIMDQEEVIITKCRPLVGDSWGDLETISSYQSVPSTLELVYIWDISHLLYWGTMISRWNLYIFEKISYFLKVVEGRYIPNAIVPYICNQTPETRRCYAPNLVPQPKICVGKRSEFGMHVSCVHKPKICCRQNLSEWPARLNRLLDECSILLNKLSP